MSATDTAVTYGDVSTQRVTAGNAIEYAYRDPARCCGRGREADAGGVAVRVQVEQRRA